MNCWWYPAYYRHKEGTKVAYFDGHVEYQKKNRSFGIRPLNLWQAIAASMNQSGSVIRHIAKPEVNGKSVQTVIGGRLKHISFSNLDFDNKDTR